MNDNQLLRYLANALEPGHREEVEAQLMRSPELRVRLEALAREVDSRLAPRNRWRIPPPGVPSGRQTFSVASRRLAIMGRPLAPGDLFEIAIAPVPLPESVWFAILSHGADGWEVRFPDSEAEVVALSDIPADTDGQRRIQVRASGQTGRQWWAVALVPMDLAIDWTLAPEARWSPLIDGIADGTVGVTSLEVEVEPLRAD